MDSLSLQAARDRKSCSLNMSVIMSKQKGLYQMDGVRKQRSKTPGSPTPPFLKFTGSPSEQDPDGCSGNVPTHMHQEETAPPSSSSSKQNLCTLFSRACETTNLKPILGYTCSVTSFTSKVPANSSPQIEPEILSQSLTFNRFLT
jgi:hypothetical protein